MRGKKRRTEPPFVQDGFEEARNKLIAAYPNAHQAHQSGLFRSVGAATTINQLFHPDKYPNTYFSTKIQKNLISYYSNVTFSDVHKWIISKSTFKFDQSFEPFLGEYKYWRCFPEDKSQSIYNIRVGSLNISRKDGFLLYQHRSANANDKQKWEDDGLAFFHGRRLYCVGFREGNIRLLIAHLPDNISTQWLHGIVLSTQVANQRIFSAAFAMFHQSYKDKFKLEEADLKLEDLEDLSLADPFHPGKIMID